MQPLRRLQRSQASQGSPARKQRLYGLLWAQFRRDQRQNRLSILRACLRYELLSEMQGNTVFSCIGYECQTFHLKKGMRRRHTLS